MYLANSVLSKIPNHKRLRHLPILTSDIQNLKYISATRPKNCNKLRKSTDRDDCLGYTYDFETMSKTTAYRNHIKNWEIETKEIFERETSSPKNIQRTLPMNIETRLDNNQLTRSTDSSKHEEKYEPEVNPDPEPSSSYWSETLSLDSRAKKNKCRKRKNYRKHRKDYSSDPSSSDDSDSSYDSHYRRKRCKNKKHWKKHLIKLCATLTAKLLTTAYKSKIIRF